MRSKSEVLKLHKEGYISFSNGTTMNMSDFLYKQPLESLLFDLGLVEGVSIGNLSATLDNYINTSDPNWITKYATAQTVALSVQKVRASEQTIRELKQEIETLKKSQK